MISRLVFSGSALLSLLINASLERRSRMKERLTFLIVLIMLSVVTIHAAKPPAPKLEGRWRVTFKMSGLEKNVIFAAGDNGAGSFKLLDTAPDDKPVAQPVPAVWSQLTNDRVSFSGEAELPIGTCCREVGTMIFKGKFTSGNEIRGTLIFVTSVDQEESAFKFRSEVGTFTANRILD
jgi:hypothetical protein